MSSRILPSSSNAAFTRSFVLVLAVIAGLLAPGAIGPGGLLATSVPASAAPPSDEDLGKDESVLRSS
ncbi:hypothetical protein [Brevibacterium aurantiacum]|uniref:hypothetical protein n=1 Tax=Brevibacterium aurantiacum TaxID=273384 RepID=UPI0011C06175|nr:hypothetical protein [Brevibacterium aurantiacum]